MGNAECGMGKKEEDDRDQRSASSEGIEMGNSKLERSRSARHLGVCASIHHPKSKFHHYTRGAHRLITISLCLDYFAAGKGSRKNLRKLSAMPSML